MFYKANEVKLKNNDSYCTDSLGVPITGTVLFDDSEESLFEINYVNGKRHGLTKITALDDSFYFETNYANGVEHGESRYYEKGKLCIVKNYKNGVENGPCVQYYPNGNIYHQYILNDGGT
ncbi:toxin-antitoxin system YwqK family antitoxin [Gilliamella sp. Pas-s27]|uniref:toxin-antitoxin system YwqK family antitoxin n=1 Tax=Gilliamella sp. Pas-s27 TaxID=2687311 RepID=UPI0013657874|nr:hypothetical protein [Gilliamella sp. Pas-s27]MWP47490.1 hypothetical protein [Gilliamella sp. Pas-s27]